MTQRIFYPGDKWVYFKIYSAPTSTNNILVIKILPLITQWIGGGIICKWFFIRYSDTGHHIRFRVELADLQFIGKVITELRSDRNGLSVEFEGVIKDDEGNTVSGISSSHFGMGAVDFVPLPGRTYRAEVSSESFPLPPAEENASVLNIAELDADSIRVSVNGVYRDNLSLIVHNGGVVTKVVELSEPENTFLRSGLGTGIVQLLLADSDGNILSSRMIFNHGGYLYGSNPDILPSGDYAVKAFRGIMPESTTSIVSNLLLQSELKGFIEDGDYYFRKRTEAVERNLDLLMMTHGWERYDLPKVLHANYDEPIFPLEIGGEISGSVKSRWKGKAMQNAVVMLIAPALDFATQVFTDEDGSFKANGFDWPDGTSFIIQVLGENGDKEHNYSVNNDEFPESDVLIGRISDGITDELTDEALLTAGTVVLDELEVTAPMTLEESRRQMLAAMGVRIFSLDDIDKIGATTYEDVLRKIPGIRIVNGNVVAMQTKNVYNTGMGGALVEFWIDGFRWTPTFAYSSGGLAKSGAQEPI